MKYSIFGFSQEYAIKLQKEKDGKVKKLDATDLLILRDVADFMNRSKIIKYTIDDKVYFSIQYATILEDLPILDIKKQALSDRLDKMVLLNVLEKIVVKNQSGTFIAFRMGSEYEKLLYSCTNIQTAPTSSELQVQMYSTTNHNTNTTNNSSTKQEKEDNLLSSQKNELKIGNYIEIHNKWEEINPNLPSIRCFNDKRKKALRTLLKNNNATIDDLYKVFEIIAVCSFCQGNNDRKWTATLDWVLNDTKSCFNRLLEGAYAFNDSEKQKVQQIVSGVQVEQTQSEQIVINGVIYK